MSTWGHRVVDSAIVDTIVDGSLQYIDPRNPRVFLYHRKNPDFFIGVLR
jgi:hypothetical protein